MFDRHLISVQKRVLAPIAKRLAERGTSADAITIVGFVIGIAAVPMLAVSAYLPALVCIILNRILDGLDGAVARLNGPTDRGAFVDIALDFFFYGAVPVGFALADPVANALPAVFLLCSFIGTGSSFLAFAAISHKRGELVAPYPGKGIQFVGGLTEGTETIALFVGMCTFPALFPVLAYIFAALALVTTMVRWWWGWTLFSSQRLPLTYDSAENSNQPSLLPNPRRNLAMTIGIAATTARMRKASVISHVIRSDNTGSLPELRAAMRTLSTP